MPREFALGVDEVQGTPGAREVVGRGLVLELGVVEAGLPSVGDCGGVEGVVDGVSECVSGEA